MLEIAPNNTGNQKAGDDEEYVDAHIAASEARLKMKQQNGQNGYRPNSVNFRPISIHWLPVQVPETNSTSRTHFVTDIVLVKQILFRELEPVTIAEYGCDAKDKKHCCKDCGRG